MTETLPLTIEAETPAQQPLAASTLGEAFARVCAMHGGRMAVTFGDRSWTYDELNAAAQAISGGLQQQGVMPGDRVAVVLERSLEMVAAMIGIVQCGAAYLPIDPAYPVQRIVETIVDAKPVALICARADATRITNVPAHMLHVEELLTSRVKRLQSSTNSKATAYVIYTSGSTGKPKGVKVSHNNVLRLFTQTERWFHFDHHDVWTMFHSFAFDFSIWEMWGALLTGARLVIVPFAVSRSPEDFLALLAAERVTILNQTPSAFALLDRAEAACPTALALRTIVFGGEALALGSLRSWFARHGDRHPELINMYGITETTVHVTYRRILRADAECEHDSLIGEPIPDLQIHLLDEHLQPVLFGAEGEICIAGAGVAQGYLDRPELTAERFVTTPYGRLYRSGDLARRRADGELVYLGRRDAQVKVNGFRIELGEVEAALAKHPAIAQCCVLVHTTQQQGTRLAAFFVSSSALTSSDLSEFLRAQLPAHMVPSLYKQRAALPLTINGKADRKALADEMTQGAFDGPVEASLDPEDLVTAAWRAVLGLSVVDLDDNFFDVGGTSLLLIELRTRLMQELQRDIPVVWMFEATSIRALAQKLSHSPTVTNRPASGNATRQREAFARARAQRGAGR